MIWYIGSLAFNSDLDKFSPRWRIGKNSAPNPTFVDHMHMASNFLTAIACASIKFLTLHQSHTEAIKIEKWVRFFNAFIL